MGITIHYSGTLDDTNRVEKMEDRMMTLVFALGGRVTIWRSHSSNVPQNGHAYVRGALFGLASENAITQEVTEQMHEQLESILDSLYEPMSDAWSGPL